jgi:hypothetical protein
MQLQGTNYRVCQRMSLLLHHGQLNQCSRTGNMLSYPVYKNYQVFIFCCFCSSITPAYCVSTLTFCKGGATSQSADTADAEADADEDVDVVLESLCFSCTPTIVDEQSKVNVIVGVLI